MPQVKDVTLAFGSFSPIGGIFINPTHNIKVNFTAVFSPAEMGQTYRVKIDLYQQRQDLTGSLEPIRRIPDPFLTFTYGFIKKDHYLLAADQGEISQEVEYFSAALQIHSDLQFSALEFSDSEFRDRVSQAPRCYFYAVVTLYPDFIATSASSNMVAPQEFGIGTLPTAVPIPVSVPKSS
jgi:hypothetical protein